MLCAEEDCSRPTLYKSGVLCTLHYDRKRKSLGNTRVCQSCYSEFPAKRGHCKYCDVCAPPGDMKALQLLNRYGITKYMYDAMYFDQDGKCELAHCRNEATVVDHRHDCSEVHQGSARGCPRCIRALVCSGCNNKLAAVDDELFFFASQEYVKEFMQ